MDMMNNTSGMYGPPGYGFPPPPPKKSRFGLIAAAIAVALGAGGYFAYNHFIGDGEYGTSSSPASGTSLSEPGSAPVMVPEEKPMAGSDASGLSDQETRYVALLEEIGISVRATSLAIQDGYATCQALDKSGSLAEAVEFMRELNSNLGEVEAIFTTVSAVQALCPQTSPFGSASGAPSQPLPPGQDGEYIRRLQSVGLSVDNRSDAISDAQKVCALMSGPSRREKFLDAAKMVAAANPRANNTAAVLLTVVAVQVYCPKG